MCPSGEGGGILSSGTFVFPSVKFLLSEFAGSPWVLEVSGVRVSEMGLLAGPGLGCFPVLCFIPVGRLTEADRCSAFLVPPVSPMDLR